MNVSQRYLADRVRSSTPGELVVLLFDGLLRFSQAVADHLEEGTCPAHAAASTAAARATDILSALTSSLNWDANPEYCAEVSRLYTFFCAELSRALREGSPEPVRRFLPLVEQLRDAWAEAINRHGGAAPHVPPATAAAA